MLHLACIHLFCGNTLSYLESESRYRKILSVMRLWRMESELPQKFSSKVGLIHILLNINYRLIGKVLVLSALNSKTTSVRQKGNLFHGPRDCSALSCLCGFVCTNSYSFCISEYNHFKLDVWNSKENFRQNILNEEKESNSS